MIKEKICWVNGNGEVKRYLSIVLLKDLVSNVEDVSEVEVLGSVLNGGKGCLFTIMFPVRGRVETFTMSADEAREIADSIQEILDGKFDDYQEDPLRSIPFRKAKDDYKENTD